jgi:hypothetical protein
VASAFVIVVIFLSAVDPRMTIHHSGRPERQAEIERKRETGAEAKLCFLNREAARASVRELRAWVETKLRERTDQ